MLNEFLRRGWIATFRATLVLPIVVGGGVAMSFGGFTTVAYSQQNDADMRSQRRLNCW